VEGATTLVTGATGGLGQAIARALAGRGARLVVSGRRAEVLEPLAAETGARAVVCDLADPAEVERLVREAGEVDVLVANAGVQAGGRIGSFSVEALDEALAVNLRAPMVLARRLLDGMVARRRGHIVFISSLAGKAASGGGSVYSATKFGLRGFGQGLREDLRRYDVGVSTVLPGFIRDAGMFHDSGARLPPYVRTKTPEDVARAVIEAIERNRGEVEVAPLPLRLGATAASLLPETSATVQRRLGAARIASDITRR
jgi:short-subunit dehydrogenase